MNPEYLGTYGLPVLQDPNKIYTLHVETPKEKWYESLWHDVTFFCRVKKSTVLRKIKLAIGTIRAWLFLSYYKTLMKIFGTDYVLDILKKKIDKQIMKDASKKVGTEFHTFVDPEVF